MGYKQYQFWGEKKLLLDQYEPTHYVRNSIIIKNIKSLVKKGLVKRVCEMGCGLGVNAKEIARLGVEVSAFDIDEDAIGFAKEYHKDKRITFSVGDALKKTAAEKFDVVLASEVIEHIKDDEKVLKQINGLLRKDGYLIVTVPANEKYRSFFDERSGHFKRYTLEGLRELVRGAGFEIIRARYLGYPLLYYYYFYVYLKAAQHKEKIKKTGFSKAKIMLLKLLSRIFLIDLFFRSKKGINLIIVAKKK